MFPSRSQQVDLLLANNLHALSRSSKTSTQSVLQTMSCPNWKLSSRTATMSGDVVVARLSSLERLKLQRSDMEPLEITHISHKVLWPSETVSQSSLHYKALREPSSRSKMKRSVPEMNMLICADNKWKNFRRSGLTS